MKYNIPLNAFSSVTVHGLVFKNGVSCAQTFHRGVVKEGPLVNIQFESLTVPGGIPPRPPSKLPPPGDRHLTLSLGEHLGRGRVGSVYGVTVMDSDIELPELVLKISRRGMSGSVAQEAWFYEELEELQGISVPRCYGFFQARLKDGIQISTWDTDRDEDEDDAEGEVQRGVEDKNLWLGIGEEELEMYNNERWGVVNEKKYVQGLPGKGRVISILLLERLGGNILVGRRVDPAIQDDVREIFNDLARLGIETLDIRCFNILSVKDDSSGIICPNHGHVHRWRMIDFDLCRKSDGNLSFIDGTSGEWLDIMFMNPPPPCCCSECRKFRWK